MSVETTGELRTTEVGSRTVAWTTYGDPNGKPVVYYHGAGGSRLEAAFLHADAAAAGLYVISIDRPGSGRTDPIPNRNLLRSVIDLAPVLDAEAVERAQVCGLSAGAMYAWASAQALGGRVSAVVAVSPAVNVRPWADVKAAMDPRMKLMAWLATHTPGVLSAIQRQQQKGFERPDGQARYVKAMRKICPDDAALLVDDDTYRDIRATAIEGRRQGNMGGQEFALLVSDWGFDPAAQTVPCSVVYGSGDPLAPMIRAWLSHAAAAVVTEVPGGHLQTCYATGREAVINALRLAGA
ncbi:MAG TPA: alpha/beta hydrolase [Mycobacteriales bacterium]|nr:alpha/beta hydrolase [Mycobacteriales bacterium]